MGKWNITTVALTDKEKKRLEALQAKGITLVSIVRNGISDAEARQPKKLFK